MDYFNSYLDTAIFGGDYYKHITAMKFLYIQKFKASKPQPKPLN